MEQRSQILKQMHLTKNEREREVRLAWLGSQSLKRLPALRLHWFGMAQGWHTSSRTLLITLIPRIPGLPSSGVTHTLQLTYRGFQLGCRGAWATDSFLCV